MSHRETAVTAKRLKLYAALVLLLACAAAGLYARGREQQARVAAQPQPVAQATPAPAQPPFPNANPNYIPPTSVYSGPLFVLSQDYPAQMPNDLPAFLTTDFKGDWKNYMLRVRDYCFEGNTDVDFRVEHNNKRHWFHIPWQDYGPQGREGIHGLTKEASVQVQQLASSQTYSGGQTYAVGFFNDYAGYTIGQVWADHSNPDPSKSSKPNGFPVGAVVFKLLFVDVPPAQVPSLANPKLWEAYVTPTYKSPPTPRVIKQMALIQMDIAVRTDDKRAPTGWLFGTFQYNGALNRPNPWENLVPLGLQWGNDPTDRADTHTQLSFKGPTDKTDFNDQLKEGVINHDAELPPTHLGWNGRLNGPVDNPISDCMSCHMTAQVPSEAVLSPAFQSAIKFTRGDAYWMRWFQNIDCEVPFGNYLAGGKKELGLHTLSTDFSLQLAISIENFCDATQSCGGDTTNDTTSVKAKTARILGAPSPKSHVPSAGGHVVQPIVRDVPEAHPKK